LAAPALEPLAEKYTDRGVNFVFLYTREAHPGEHFEHHRNLEQKLSHAAAFVDTYGLKRPMLVDDLDGPLHTAYGLLPNMTYIINPRGQIAFRSNWTDAHTTDTAISYLLSEGENRREGVRSAPFYAEFLGHRAIDRPAFMEGLYKAGPRAVEEFIHATKTTQGETAAQSLRDWWAKRQQA